MSILLMNGSKFIAISVFTLTLMQVSYLPRLPPTPFFVVLPVDTINNNNNSNNTLQPTLPPPPQAVPDDVKSSLVVDDDNNIMKEERGNNTALTYVDSTLSATTTSDATDITTTTTTTTHDHDDDNNEEWWKSFTGSADTLLSDIDRKMMKKTTTCGYWKCYYPSKSHPNYGYIIGQRRNQYKSNSDFFSMEQLQQGYDLALKLKEEYNLDHFMVSEPIPMNATKQLAQVLNHGVASFTERYYRENNKSWFRETHPTKHKRDKIIVQVVKFAPQPNLLIQLGPIIRNGNNSSMLDLPPVQSFFNNNNNTLLSDDFIPNLLKDWNATCFALESEPGLYRDFQFMLDNQGHIWQMDLDRVYGTARAYVNSPDEIQKLIIDPILSIMKQR